METKKIIFTATMVGIFLLGVFLRLVNLEKNPNGLYVDEASPGYNAWSILETGKDEYGKDYPLAFKFLGSFTPPLYTYATVLPVKLFGLSIFSTRITSAISGILLIFVFYIFLTNLKITQDKWVLIIGLLFFSICPWAIFYSRIGYEINLAFLIYSLGVLFLWLSLKKRKFIILGLGMLSLSMSAYHGERLLVPLTLVTYFFIFREILFKKIYRKTLLIGLSVFLLGIIPQLLIFFTPANTVRGVGLFYFDAIFQQANNSIMPGIISVPLSTLREFSSQYFAYLSPRNLFFQPDSDLQRSLPELSTYYPWMVILYFIGIYQLIKIRKTNAGKFLIALFLIAPVPAALTGDPFSTQRSLPLLLPLSVILCLGLVKIFDNKFQKLIIVVIIISCAFSLFTLYRSLAVLLPNERAKIWGYGYSLLADEIRKNPNEKFLIDTSRIKPAYIELAFFLKYPPEKLQQVVDPKIRHNYYYNLSFDTHYNFANIETRNINWEKDIYKKQILVGDELVVSEVQMKEHFLTHIFTIKSPSREIIFKGYRTNPELKCKNSLSTEC